MSSFLALKQVSVHVIVHPRRGILIKLRHLYMQQIYLLTIIVTEENLVANSPRSRRGCCKPHPLLSFLHVKLLLNLSPFPENLTILFIPLSFHPLCPLLHISHPPQSPHSHGRDRREQGRVYRLLQCISTIHGNGVEDTSASDGARTGQRTVRPVRNQKSQSAHKSSRIWGKTTTGGVDGKGARTRDDVFQNERKWPCTIPGASAEKGIFQAIVTCVGR